MLRQFGRQLQTVWVLLDITVYTGTFIALALLPGFSQYVGDGALSELHPLSVAAIALWVGLGWQIVLGRFGLYESHRRSRLSNLVLRLLCANAVGALFIAGASIALGVAAPLTFPLALAGIAFSIQAAMRVPAFFLLRTARRAGRNFRNILIVGTGPRAEEASQTIDGHPEWGLRVIGYLDDGDPTFRPCVPTDKIHKFIDLPSLLRNETVDEVLVACPRTMLSELTPVVRECALVGIPVTLLTDLFGDQLPAPRIGTFDSLETLSFAPVHHNELELLVKRGMDVVGALVGLALFGAVIGLAAIAIRLDSRGPIFFRQIRVGLNGRRFEMVKLRTMTVDADRIKGQLAHLNEADGPVFKIRKDPRITRVGRLLRKYSIDELPQFWNVFKGDMSLVGPRPPTPDEVVLYEGHTRRRLSMRPGLTCYWQISGRSDVSFAEWIKLDLKYIDTWSLWNDLVILLRTVPEVLLGRGAS